MAIVSENLYSAKEIFHKWFENIFWREREENWKKLEENWKKIGRETVYFIDDSTVKYFRGMKLL